jgi:hypothetical protein
MTLSQGNLIDPQNPDLSGALQPLGSFGPALEDLFDRSFVQPGTLGHRFATTVQTLPIDGLLEASGLSPLGSDTGQPFGKGLLTPLTLKPSPTKVQKGTLAPHLYISHTPLFFIVDGTGKLTTVGTNRCLMRMDTIQMDNFLTISLFNFTAHHRELRQVQQMTDREFFEPADYLPNPAFDRPSRIFKRFDNSYRQRYSTHLQASFELSFGCSPQLCRKLACLSNFSHYFVVILNGLIVSWLVR